MHTFADQRIVRGAPATISWQGVDQDGEAANPGTVTVGIMRADGTVLVAAGTATTGSGTDPRTIALTAAQTATLDLLTATWSVGGVAVGSSVVQIVGGVYTTLTAIRGTDSVLADRVRDSDESLKRARASAERLFESVTGVAWVPAFDVCRLDGTGTQEIALPWPKLRRVRWARIWTDEDTYDDLEPGDIAAIPADDSGIAVRTDLDWWPRGRRNIEIGYEHGYDRPPSDMVDGLVQTVRQNARQHDNGIDPRATTLVFEGGSATLATPGVGNWHTGIPVVDDMLRRYNHTTPGIA